MTQSDWFSGVRAAIQDLTRFLPAIAGALLLLLAGWLVGRVLAWLARRGIKALLARISRRDALRHAIDSSDTARQMPGLIAGFVFWAVFVFFTAAALETLGLPVVTASLSRLAYYLPNVLAALLMLFAGIIVAKLTGTAVTRAATGAGMAFASGLGAAARSAVIVIAAVVAVQQIGIRADLLIIIVAVVVGTTLAGAGLAFGLGARTAVSNIISSYYVSQTYRVGQSVRVGTVEGKIVQTTPTAVFIAAREGRVMIPAKQFSEEASILITES
jgi:hypothetical protein